MLADLGRQLDGDLRAGLIVVEIELDGRAVDAGLDAPVDVDRAAPAAQDALPQVARADRHAPVVLVGLDLRARHGVDREGRQAVAAPGLAVARHAVALGGVHEELAPARDAARTPPARALKAGDEQTLFERVVPAWPGLILVATGGALTQLGPVRGLPLFGYVAIACLLMGAIALVPRIAQLFFGFMPLPSYPPLRLALGQLRAAPGQAAVSLAAIVASFSLMAAMAIMVASFRESVDEWLGRVLPAEVYFRTTHAGDTSALDPRFEASVRALPQVARADFLRSGRIVLDPTRPPLVLIARDHAEKTFPLMGERYQRRAQDPPPVWISEAVVDLYGFSPGRRLELPMLNRTHSVVVAGVFRDYARQHGAVLIERADYIALTGDRTANDGALWLVSGATPAEVMQALRALPGGEQLDIAEPGEIREVCLRIFDRSVAVTYAMEAVAVLVGLFGLSSSLGAIVLARRREFGVLRHLGLTRSQIRGMLAAEGGLLALVGSAAGLVAGAAISLVLVYVVNRQSFHWSMEVNLPWLPLTGLALLIVGGTFLYGLAGGGILVSALRELVDPVLLRDAEPRLALRDRPLGSRRSAAP